MRKLLQERGRPVRLCAEYFGPSARGRAVRARAHVVGDGSWSTAFTLIELLVVVAIMGIVMTICVPFIHNAMDRRKGMSGAIRDVQEACKFARDWAILQQSDHELRIRPHDGVFEVGGASAPITPTIDHRQQLSSVDLSGNEWRIQDNYHAPLPTPSKPGGGGGSFSVRLPEGVTIEGLGVNGEDWTEDEVARVRFYPNGTSDEMSVVLLRAETNERRNIWLEVVTGLPELESDPSKFKAR